MRPIIILAAAIFGLLAPLQSQTVWSGAVDSDWANPGNWLLGPPSNVNQPAIIPPGALAIISAPETIDYAVEVAGDLQIAADVVNDGIFINTGGIDIELGVVLTNNGNIENNNFININGELINENVLFNQTGLILVLGTLTNNADFSNFFEVLNVLNLTNGPNGIISNLGNIENAVLSVFTNDGVINNGGSILLDLDATLINNLLISVSAVGSINNAFGIIENHLGATLESYGMVSNEASFINDGNVITSGVFSNTSTAQFTNTTTAGVNNSSTFTNDGELGNMGIFMTTNTFSNRGNITNQGPFTATNTFMNAGNIAYLDMVSNFGTLTNTGIISNEGLFRNEGGATIDNSSFITNFPCATFTGQDASSSTNTAPGQLLNNGIVYQLGTAVIEFTPGTGVVLTDLANTPAPTPVCLPAFPATLDPVTNTVTVDPADIDDGSTADYCSIGSLTLSQTDFDCSHVGDNTVTLTVTDALGNTATCNTIITILDPTPPTISCPGDILVDLLPGQCGQRVNFTITADDPNCLANLVVNQIDGTGLRSDDEFPAGVTTLEFEATDGTNTVSCSFDITLDEYVPITPALACNQNVQIALDGSCEARVHPDMILEGEYGCWDDFVEKCRSVDESCGSRWHYDCAYCRDRNYY